MCPKMDVDPGQRPFFIVKLKRNLKLEVRSSLLTFFISSNMRLIGQKVCPKMDVDPGQRPFFIVKLKRNDFPARTKSVS